MRNRVRVRVRVGIKVRDTVRDAVRVLGPRVRLFSPLRRLRCAEYRKPHFQDDGHDVLSSTGLYGCG